MLIVDLFSEKPNMDGCPRNMAGSPGSPPNPTAYWFWTLNVT